MEEEGSETTPTSQDEEEIIVTPARKKVGSDGSLLHSVVRLPSNTIPAVPTSG